MIAAAMFGFRRSGILANRRVGSGLTGRISEAWPTLAPPGGQLPAISFQYRFYSKAALSARLFAFVSGFPPYSIDSSDPILRSP